MRTLRTNRRLGDRRGGPGSAAEAAEPAIADTTRGGHAREAASGTRAASCARAKLFAQQQAARSRARGSLAPRDAIPETMAASTTAQSPAQQPRVRRKRRGRLRRARNGLGKHAFSRGVAGGRRVPAECSRSRRLIGGFLAGFATTIGVSAAVLVMALSEMPWALDNGSGRLATSAEVRVPCCRPCKLGRGFGCGRGRGSKRRQPAQFAGVWWRCID